MGTLISDIQCATCAVGLYNLSQNCLATIVSNTIKALGMVIKSVPMCRMLILSNWKLGYINMDGCSSHHGGCYFFFFFFLVVIEKEMTSAQFDTKMLQGNICL